MLSTRAKNCLRTRLGYDAALDPAAIVQIPKTDLLKFKGLGTATLEEITTWLTDSGHTPPWEARRQEQQRVDLARDQFIRAWMEKTEAVDIPTGIYTHPEGT